MLLPSLVWQPNNDTRLLLEAFYENLPKAGGRNFLLRRGTVDAVEGQTVSTRFFAGDPIFRPAFAQAEGGRRVLAPLQPAAHLPAVSAPRAL